MSSFASASLYVGDLAPEVTEALLFEIFNAVGPVASVRVCRDAATRRSLGYAYVNFHRVEDAERALDTMNFTDIRERPCRIMWSHRDPSLRKSGLGNIFVKNLAPSIDNKTLYDTFSMFGNILSCKVARNRKGESLGYGFVHYESEEAAKNAIERVNGMVIAEQKVNVMPFKSKAERGGTKAVFTNLYVKNIEETVTKEELDELFSKYGKITSSMIAMQDEKSRGFGFVNFENPEDAAKAQEELNGKDLKGKELFVARAQKKEERERELRSRFEQLRAERQKKYAGVNLYVKNLAEDMTDDELRETFSKCGDITSCKVMTDSQGRSRGFGFVCFASPEEAQKAVLDMNNSMVKGKPLYVALAQRKEVRRAQLEAQYAARNKMIPGPAAMGYPQGPMFYPGMPQPGPQRVMGYPQQMGMPRRGPWPQGGRPPMMGGPAVGYPMGGGQVPMNNGGNRGPRGRGQRNNSGRGRQNQQGFKYTAQVRNREQQQPNMQQQGSQPVPAVGQMPMSMGAPAPLTIQALAAAPEEQQKQMIGERLFPLIQNQEPQLAGKITGMLLEMDNGELLHLLESAEARSEKIQEALAVLRQHQTVASDTATNSTAAAPEPVAAN